MMGVLRFVRWVRLRYHSAHETFWLELFSGVLTVGWPLFVYWMPPDLAERPPYFLLATIAPDEVWETTGIVLGVAQLVALAVRWKLGRWIVSSLLVWWWCVLFLGVFESGSAGPGVILYGGQALENLMAVLLLYRPGFVAVRCARE